jgi:hypothetical protein
MAVSEDRTRKRNTVIHSEVRELISKAIQTCDEEASKKELEFPVSQARREQKENLEKSYLRPVRKEIRGLKIPNFKSTISTNVL